MLGEHLWLVLHHSQASSILACDLLQGHEREKMPIRPHDAMESSEIIKVAPSDLPAPKRPGRQSSNDFLPSQRHLNAAMPAAAVAAAINTPRGVLSPNTSLRTTL